MVGDVLTDVPVLLRCAGGVELLEVEAPVDDGLEQVERPDRVRHHRLVRTVPRLSDVRLGTEVEEVRPIRRVLELTDEVVDRRPVGQVGEMDLEAVAEVPDVVQRAARRRAHERVHVRAELDERIGQVRPHEAVGAGDERGAAAVNVAEVGAKLVPFACCPDGVGRHGAYASASVGKRTDSTGLGSLATGAITALGLAVQTGLAAVVGVIIARELGRNAETDGFFAAYGVFIVILLIGNAIRVTMLPSFARARTEGRLAGAVVSTGLLVGSFVALLVIVAIAAAEPLADLLTGEGPELARSTAAEALPWMVAAGALQVLAGQAASALAALDDYVTAAVGFVSGSVAGLALILVLIDDHGVQAVTWGMALNGSISLLVPSIVLVVRARAAGLSGAKLGTARAGSASSTLRLLLNGVALPLALQAIYVICLPPASREGEGAVTSLGYAYLFSSAVVAVTASSIGLVTAVPMTRAGLGEGRAARHIVASAWLGVVAIGFTAGVLALAGGTFIETLLGRATRAPPAPRSGVSSLSSHHGR